MEGYGKKSDRRPFTKDELTQLFAAPLFTQPWTARHSRSSVPDTTLRWLFPLGLTTGARIEKLGQVHLADIKQEAGVWYVEVDDYMLEEDGATKSVKNDGSVRILPIHPRLVELGFLDHVTATRGSGSAKLFPDLKADRLSVQTEEASRRAARLIDTVVSTDPRLVFHSFRHSFKDACRDADLPKDVHDQLTGHAPADVGGGYGLGRAATSRLIVPSPAAADPRQQLLRYPCCGSRLGTCDGKAAGTDCADASGRGDVTETRSRLLFRETASRRRSFGKVRRPLTAAFRAGDQRTQSQTYR